MDEKPDMRSWRLTIPGGLYAELQRHLFPGDGEEHAGVILAGTCNSERGLRLVARELHLAKDGVDYVPGKRGYRMLKAEFIQSKILRARDRRLAYLAIHNHGGTDTVGFSGIDMASPREVPGRSSNRSRLASALVLATAACKGLVVSLPGVRTRTRVNFRLFLCFTPMTTAFPKQRPRPPLVGCIYRKADVRPMSAGSSAGFSR